MREFDPLRYINTFIYPPRLRSSLRLSFGRFALFLVSILLGVGFFSGILFSFFYWQISQLRDTVLRELEQTIGFSFAYDSIDPHFLSKFKIHNARIFDPEMGEEETILSFSSLELTIDIWAILGFNKDFLIQKVVLNDLSVLVDLESLQERQKFEKLSGLLNSEGDTATEGNFLTSLQNRRNFSLYINNLNLNLKAPRVGTLELSTDNISLVLVNGRWDLSGFLSLLLKESQIPALSGFSSGFGLKGFGKLDPWQAQLILTVQNFSGENFQIVDHGYFLSVNSEYLRLLNTTGDNFNLDVLYEFNPSELRGSFTVNDWKLLNLLSLPEDANQSLKDLLTYSLEAEGQVEYARGELSYSLQARTDLDERFPELFQGALFLDLKGNENWLHVEDLTFKNTTGGSLGFEGDFSFKDFFPRGELSFSRFVWQDSQPLSGSLLMGEVPRGGYFLRSQGLSLGDFSLSGIEAFVENSGEALDFRGMLTFPSELPSQISFSGNYPFADQLSFSMDMQNFPLDHTYLLLPPTLTSEAETLQAFTSGFMSNARLRGNFNLGHPEESTISLLEVSAQNRISPEQGIFLDASGTKSQIQLSRFDIMGNGIFAKTKGVLNLEPGLLLSSTLNVNLNDQKNIPLDWLLHTGDKTLELKSQNSLSLLLNYADGLNGLFTMTDFVLPLGETSLTFNHKLSISGEKGRDWLIDWEKFDLAVKNSPFVPDWSLSWQALLTKDILTVENVAIADSLSRFQGGGVVQDWLTAGKGTFFLSSEETKEGLQVLWNTGEKEFSLDIAGSGLWTEHFQEPKLPVEEGLLDLGISLLWQEGQDLITSVNLKLRDAYLGELPVKAESKFALLAGHVISPATKVQIADRIFFLDDLNVDLSDQSYSFKAYLQQENPRNLRLSDLSRWQGKGSWKGEGESLGFKSSFLIDRIQQKSLKGKVLDFTLTKEGELISVTSGDGVSLAGSYHTGTGRLSAVSSDPYPLKLKMEGFALPDLLDLRIENLALEVADLPLSIMIPDAFALHTGYITGNLFLGGTLARPEFNGKLYATGARVSTPYVGKLNLDGTPNEQIIGPFEAVGFATGNLIYLVNSSAEWTGVNTIEDLPAIETQIDRDRAGVRGLFTMDGWELDKFQLWVDTLTARRGVPVAFYQAGIKAQGYALGNFFLEVQGENIGLRGDFTLNQVDMTLAEEKAKPQRRKPMVEPIVSADFDITLGRAVRFLWPNEIVPLLRAIADTNQKVKVKVDGENGDFSLVGDVGIRGGNLTYYSSSFLITKGRIILNENQNSFNPIIEAEAETRITDTSGTGGGDALFSGRSGQSIRIILTVNSLLSEMLENATLSSSPSKSQDEIRILLGIGDVSFDKISGAQDLGEAGLNLASGLVTNVIFKPIEDFFRNTLNLDYFSLSSDWLKRLSTRWLGDSNISSSDVDKLGNANPSATRTVSANGDPNADLWIEVLENTRVSTGKYIADGVFFEGGFTLSRGRETYEGRPIKAVVDVGFELNASPLIVGWQAGLDLANLTSVDAFSNKITVGWSFSY